MQIKLANLFEAAITWDTFHKKEQSGQLDKELQERIERKTAELESKIDKAAIMANIEKALNDYLASAK